MTTITREQAQKIIDAADEVITALAGTNDDVHPDNSRKMCDLWDDLNDRYAPPEVVRELARIALASLEAEAVTNEIVIPEPATHRNINEICPPGVNQTLFASGWNASRKSGMNSGRIPPIVKGIDAECVGWNACRAAMLQGAEPVSNSDELPDDFISMLTGRAKYLREKGEIKSPELLERAAAALQGENFDTHAIPNGWKLVPIDPTKDMLRAGQSVVGFWLNTVHCYSKMLAAAPAAPQQEAE